jgi:hypothetical protein
VPDLVGEEKAGFFYTAEVKKRESLGEIVETLDQKVETRLFSSATTPGIDCGLLIPSC